MQSHSTDRSGLIACDVTTWAGGTEKPRCWVPMEHGWPVSSVPVHRCQVLYPASCRRDTLHWRSYGATSAARRTGHHVHHAQSLCINCVMIIDDDDDDDDDDETDSIFFKFSFIRQWSVMISGWMAASHHASPTSAALAASPQTSGFQDIHRCLSFVGWHLWTRSDCHQDEFWSMKYTDVDITWYVQYRLFKF